MAFAKNLAAYRGELSRQNYLHIEDALSESFIASLRSYGERIAAGSIDEIKEWYIPGKKRQYLFNFPSVDFLNAFRAGIAAITGDNPDEITIGERHIKYYLEKAKAYPSPHMDRKAAQFTIGFPIHIPEQSRVCFFPHLSREENSGDRALYAKLPETTDMEDYYSDDRIARYRGKIGDMIIFHGSTIFHERIHGAGAIILYIKVNAVGNDPLGENASLVQSLEIAPAD